MHHANFEILTRCETNESACQDFISPHFAEAHIANLSTKKKQKHVNKSGLRVVLREFTSPQGISILPSPPLSSFVIQISVSPPPPHR